LLKGNARTLSTDIARAAIFAAPAATRNCMDIRARAIWRRDPHESSAFLCIHSAKECVISTGMPAKAPSPASTVRELQDDKATDDFPESA
jgi:hypothetical protein